MKVKLFILFSLFLYALHLCASTLAPRIMERPIGTATVNEKNVDRVKSKKTEVDRPTSNKEVESEQQKQEVRRNNLDPTLYDVNVPTWR